MNISFKYNISPNTFCRYFIQNLLRSRHFRHLQRGWENSAIAPMKWCCNSLTRELVIDTWGSCFLRLLKSQQPQVRSQSKILNLVKDLSWMRDLWCIFCHPGSLNFSKVCFKFPMMLIKATLEIVVPSKFRSVILLHLLTWVLTCSSVSSRWRYKFSLLILGVRFFAK